jgi:hypothetical protein
MNSEEERKSLHEDDEDEENGSKNKIDMYMKLLNKTHLQHIWDHVLKGFCVEDISNFKRFMVLKSVSYHLLPGSMLSGIICYCVQKNI